MGQLCGSKSVGLCVASSPQSVTFISMGSSTLATVGYFEYHCCAGGCLAVKGALREMFFVVVCRTLTDPLGIQPWSQDRRNQTKSNREQFQPKKRYGKQTEETYKKVASKGHHRQEGTPKRQQQEVKVRLCVA